MGSSVNKEGAKGGVSELNLLEYSHSQVWKNVVWTGKWQGRWKTGLQGSKSIGSQVDARCKWYSSGIDTVRCLHLGCGQWDRTHPCHLGGMTLNLGCSYTGEQGCQSEGPQRGGRTCWQKCQEIQRRQMQSYTPAVGQPLQWCSLGTGGLGAALQKRSWGSWEQAQHKSAWLFALMKAGSYKERHSKQLGGSGYAPLLLGTWFKI